MWSSQVGGKPRRITQAPIPERTECPYNNGFEDRNEKLWQIFFKEHKEGCLTKKFWWMGTIFTFPPPSQPPSLNSHVGPLLPAPTEGRQMQQLQETARHACGGNVVRLWFTKLHSVPFIRAPEKKLSVTSIPRTAVFLLHNVSFFSYRQYRITEVDSPFNCNLLPFTNVYILGGQLQ